MQSVWSLEMFVVSQAFISMLANRGTVLCVDVLVPLWWFVKSTLSCPTPFNFVCCYVINQRGRWLWLSGGDVTECIVYMFFPVLFFPVLFPQCPCRGRLFVYCCGRCSCVHLRGEPTLFPGWLCTNKSDVIATSNLWIFIHASNLLPLNSVVWGVEGKQVGSMDEESQVRGCYNITFICTPTNQETVSVHHFGGY